MTDQRVKVMVEQIKDSHTFTKEFEVVIKGLHQDEGVGIKPKVAPAVQQWYGKEGQSSITSDTVLATGDSGFDQSVTFYQSDLASRGLELATGDKQAQKRIELKKLKTRVMVRKVMPSLSKMVSLPSKLQRTQEPSMLLVLFFKWGKAISKMEKFVISQVSATVALC